MVRTRLAPVALAASLALACGCSSSSGTSFFSRLCGRNSGTCTEVGPIMSGQVIDGGMMMGSPLLEGPIIGDPGCMPVPETMAPPLAPPPRSITDGGHARRMPATP